MENFKHRFEIIYKIFVKDAADRGMQANKLAFAKFLGISQGKMQYWERGNWPSVADCALIAGKLGLNLAWIVTGEEEPFVSGQGTRTLPVSWKEETDLADKEKLAMQERLNKALEQANAALLKLNEVMLENAELLKKINQLELERAQKGKQPAVVREKTATVAGEKRASAG